MRAILATLVFTLAAIAVLRCQGTTPPSSSNEKYSLRNRFLSPRSKTINAPQQTVAVRRLDPPSIERLNRGQYQDRRRDGNDDHDHDGPVYYPDGHVHYPDGHVHYPDTHSYEEDRRPHNGRGPPPGRHGPPSGRYGPPSSGRRGPHYGQQQYGNQGRYGNNYHGNVGNYGPQYGQPSGRYPPYQGGHGPPGGYRYPPQGRYPPQYGPPMSPGNELASGIANIQAGNTGYGVSQLINAFTMLHPGR